MIRRTIAAICVLLIILSISLYSTFEDNVFKEAMANTDDKFYIIIDAGHGGFDGGAVASDGTIEKDLNLNIALKLDSILRMFGYNTFLVRREDISIDDNTSGSKKASDIKNRVALMSKYPNSLFISIHMNKYSATQPHGAQVFYANFDGSQQLAQCIQESVHENVQQNNNRVIKPTTKSIYLLNHATVPAVIVECGFLSNPEDLMNLKDQNYQTKIAVAVALGITDFYIK